LLLAIAITLTFAAVWFVTLHPQQLGGPAGYLIVGGQSMEPMLHVGDLAVVVRQSEYRVGDVVAYAVPAGDLATGQRIIHRIVAIDGDRFVLRGDNVNGPDLWRPSVTDIQGRLSFWIPGAGRTAVFLRSPAFLAAMFAAATVVYLLRPRGRLAARTERPPAYA
jgi:signal peptidase I